VINGLRQWWHCFWHPGHRPLKLGNGWVVRKCMDCNWVIGPWEELKRQADEATYKRQPWLDPANADRAGEMLLEAARRARGEER
jgi:hypothetical protein